MSENLNTVLPNAQNPTLLPNFSQYSSAGNVSVAQSPAQRLLVTPRVAATNATTVGGSANPTDVATLTLANPVLPGGSLSVSYTVGESDTLYSIGEGLAAALTSSLVAMAYQIYGTSSQGVVTVNELGPVGNYTVVTGSVSEGADVTLTPASSGVMSGGSGPVIPFLNFNSSQGLVNLKFALGNVYDLAPATVADLVQSGSPIL